VSGSGRQRPIGDDRATSALPPIATRSLDRSDRRKGPEAEVG